MTAIHTIKSSEIIGQITMQFRFQRSTKVRLWLAVKLAQLSAWVAGMGCEISTDDDDQVAEASNHA